MDANGSLTPNFEPPTAGSQAIHDETPVMTQPDPFRLGASSEAFHREPAAYLTCRLTTRH